MPDKDRGNCIGCGSELLALDDNPNGAHNSTCKKCVAEEDHDFDRFPGVTFTRSGEQIDPPKPVPVAPKRTLRDVFDGATVKAQLSETLDGNEEVKALRAALTASWAIMDDKDRQRFWNDPAVAEIAGHAYAFCEEAVDDIVNHVLAQQVKFGFQNDKSNIDDCVTEFCLVTHTELTPHGHRLACERILEQQEND